MRNVGAIRGHSEYMHKNNQLGIVQHHRRERRMHVNENEETIMTMRVGGLDYKMFESGE